MGTSAAPLPCRACPSRSPGQVGSSNGTLYKRTSTPCDGNGGGKRGTVGREECECDGEGECECELLRDE